MNKIAGDILYNARVAKKVTQAEMADILAEKLGHSYSGRMYQKLEAGDFPKFKKTIAMALDEILGTNLTELVYNSASNTNVNRNEESSTRKGPRANNTNIVQMTAEDRINELLRDKEILQKSIQLSLNALLEGQRDIKAMLRTNQQNIDDLLADNGRELEEVRVSTGKRNAANLGLALKMDTSDLESTSSHLKST